MGIEDREKQCWSGLEACRTLSEICQDCGVKEFGIKRLEQRYSFPGFRPRAGIRPHPDDPGGFVVAVAKLPKEDEAVEEKEN